MTQDIQSTVLVHFNEDGEVAYHVVGDDVRLFLIDERAPNDRVYEWTTRSAPEVVRELIPFDTKIGHQNDERHEAIAHRVLSAMDGKCHLRPVGDDA